MYTQAVFAIKQYFNRLLRFKICAVSQKYEDMRMKDARNKEKAGRLPHPLPSRSTASGSTRLEHCRPSNLTLYEKHPAPRPRKPVRRPPSMVRSHATWRLYSPCYILRSLCRLRLVLLGAVALTVGSVPRRIVSKLRQFHWLLKMSNQ